MNLADLRREYTKGGLRRADLDPNPLIQFQKWFEQALNSQLIEPSAMTLATADEQGRPSARIVLLKAADERGFVFFTNYDSRKGRELARNPHAALVLYWAELEREICIAGEVTKVSSAESEKYFALRPRGSQLGACVARQSSVVPDRAFLEVRLQELEQAFANHVVEKPRNWGGYLLTPSRIEFWQGRPNRLHDRFQYFRKNDGSWIIERLSP
ncbi:MAG TPA: pyridoxamine 5'-phosphate oxidase [Candidatus Limnocylindria bacterium]|nr:pyridoxamine 5'-phosphate oxidase [Candidatus Limnocylindria bacterium]